MRIGINVNGKEVPVEVDDNATDRDIEEIAASLGHRSAPAAPPQRVALPGGGVGIVGRMGPAGAPNQPQLSATSVRPANPALGIMAGLQAGGAVGRVPAPAVASATQRAALQALTQNLGSVLKSPVPVPKGPVQAVVPHNAKTNGPSILVPQNPLGSKRQMVEKAMEIQAREPKGDPFDRLPFTREEFQRAVNDPSLPVRLKNGKAIPYVTAAKIVTTVTGTRDFKADRSASDIEAEGIARAYTDAGKAGLGKTVGFDKAKKGQVLRKGDGKDTRYRDRQGNVVKTSSGVMRDLVARMGDDAEKAARPVIDQILTVQTKGLHRILDPKSEVATSLARGVAMLPAELTAEALTATDSEEKPDVRAGAAANLMMAAATSAAGAALLKGLAAPARAALMELFAASKAGKAILAAKDSGEAINAAMGRLKVSRPEAEKIVAQAVEHLPEVKAKWEPVSGNFSDRPIPAKGAKPTAVGTKSKTVPVVEAEPVAPPAVQEPAVAPAKAPVAVPKDGNLYDPTPEPIVPPAKAKAGVKPEPVRPRTGQEPFVGPTTETPGKFAASNAASNDLRGSVGLGELPNSPRSVATPANAAESFDHGATLNRARSIVADVSAGKKAPVLSETEQLHLGEMAASVAKRHNDIRRRLAKGYAEGKTTQEMAGLEADLIRAREDVDAATLANKYTGTEWSRSGQARNAAYAEDLTPAGVYEDFTRLKKGKLDPKEAAEAERLGAELEKAQARIAELTAARDAKAAATKGTSLRSKTPRTVEQIQASRAEATVRLKQKWEAKSKELAGQANSTLPGVVTLAKIAHVAPEVLEIVKGFADEGVVKLSELIAKTRAVAKEAGVDLSDEDVANIIEGRYEKPKRETSPTAAAQQLKAWREELGSARKAERKAKAEIERNQAEEIARIEREARAEARRVKAAEAADVRNKTQEALNADKAAERAKATERKAQGKAQAEADKQARNERRDAVRDAVKAEREATAKAAREEAYWQRQAEAASRKNDAKAAAEARRSQAKATAELRDSTRKLAAAERRERAQEYERLFGERSRLENNIQEYRRKIREGDFETKKPKPRDPELQDAYIKLEALKVEAAARKAALENKTAFDEAMRKGGISKTIALAGQGAGLLRGVKSSTDLSAALNQGLMPLLTLRGSVAWAKAWPSMIKSLFSEKGYIDVLAKVRASDNFESAVASGLNVGDDVIFKEEGLIADRLLGYTVAIPASNRAYNAFLTKLRMDMFDSYLRSQEAPWLRMFGQPTKATADEMKQIAEVVNTFTGVGTGKLAASLKNVNRVTGDSALFAPGYRISRFKLAFGSPLFNAAIRKNPKLAARVLTDYGAAMASLFGIVKLAQASGANVETDPRSSRWMQVEVAPDVWMDLTGGMARPLRFVSQLAVGSKSKDGDLSDPDWSRTLGYDLTGQLAPFPRVLATVAQKKSFGQNYDATTEEGRNNLAWMFAPISIETTREIWNEQGLTPEQKAVLTIAAFTGGNINVNDSASKR